MTAISAVVLPDRVVMVSDGRAVDPQGRPVHSIPKVSMVPHLSMGIGVRGTRMMSSVVVDAVVANASSFDDLHARIVPIIREHVFLPGEAIWKRQFGPNCMDAEIVVGGWSEVCGPAAFILATSDANAAFGLPAWKVIDVPAAFFSPDDGSLAGIFAKADFSDVDAIELIARQSRLKTGVGDFCQLTTVRRDAIDTRILKRW